MSKDDATSQVAATMWTIAALALISCAWMGWSDYASGRSVSLILIATTVWVCFFVWHRWLRLKHEIAAGTLTPELFKAEPQRYILGPVRALVLWCVVLAAATLAAAWWQYIRAEP